MVFIKRFFNWMTNKQDQQKNVYHSLIEEDLIKTKGVNEALKKENSSLRKSSATKDAQLAEIKAKEFEKKEKTKKQDLSDKIAKELNEQKKEIDSDRFGKWVSLKKLFYSKKFKKGKITSSDKNGEMDWGLSDVRLSTKSYIGFFDREKKLIHYAHLSGLIYKPEGIINYLKRGVILLARDKNGDFIDEIDEEDGIDNLEMSVPIYHEETGKYEKTKLLRDKIRKIIIDLQDKNLDLGKKLERSEMARVGLVDENIEKDRLINILQFGNKLGKTAVSDTLQEHSLYQMGFSDVNKKISSLSERTTLQEKEINTWKDLAEKLLKQIDELGDLPAKKAAKAEYMDAIDAVKANTITIERETIIEKPAKNNLPPPPK